MGLQRFGWQVEIVDLRKFDWVPSRPLPEWKLVFNRIASRPADDDPALLTLARDLLGAIQLSGIPCLNGAGCHVVGASKLLQASLFAKLGVPTPWTLAVSPATLERKLAEFDGRFPLLIKSNTGGRGRGISSPHEVNAETFAPDGIAILQERITSGDGLIHRVEMIGAEVLYEADAPLHPNSFDYCLAGMEPSTLGFRREPPGGIASVCRRLASAAAMDLGSIEFLIDESGELQFIDLNPVSSLMPDAAARLGFDPTEKLDALLEARIRGTG